MIRLIVLLCFAVLITACHREPLAKTLERKDQAYVCKYFAHYMFEGDAGKALVFRQEIRRAGYEKGNDCKMIYESVMTSRSARPERRVPWETAIGPAQ
jgi:hypothetical protein